MSRARLHLPAQPRRRLAALLVVALAAAVLAASPASSPAHADEGLQPPGRPTGLEATATAGSLDVAVDWDDTAGADDYLVRWRLSGAGNPLNDGVRPTSSDTTITVAGHGSWVVRVQACNTAGCSAAAAVRFTVEPAPEPTPTTTTAPVTTTTTAPEPTPTTTTAPAPETLSVSVTATATTVPVTEAVTLSADISNAPAGAAGYLWEMSYGGGWFTLASEATASYLTSSPETVSFRVTVTYGSGESATSDPVAVTFVNPTPTTTVPPTTTTVPATERPARPAGLDATTTAGSVSVAVDWDDVAGADDYLVRWRLSGPGQALSAGVRPTSSATSIDVSGSGTWVVRVQACNTVGCSAAAAVRFRVQAPPAVPANLELAAADGEYEVDATWDATDDTTHYQVGWRSLDANDFDFARSGGTSPLMEGLLEVLSEAATVAVGGAGEWQLWVQACNANGCSNPAFNQMQLKDGVQGQSDTTTFVSSLSQTASTNHLSVGDSGTSVVSVAVVFTTGNNAGITLSEVDMKLESVPAGAGVQVSLWSATTGGLPSAKLYNLTNPTTISANNLNTFTAPANSTLDANTTYAVVLENTATGTANVYSVSVTESLGEDSGAKAGWSIANVGGRRQDTGNWNTLAVSLIKIAIKGTDTTAPTLSTAVVDGSTLTLVYNETLDTGSTPATSAFTVTAGSNALTVSSVAVSGTRVTLTLSSAVTVGQPVLVSYTVPSANPIQDALGNDAAALTSQEVAHLLGVSNTGQTQHSSNIGVGRSGTSDFFNALAFTTGVDAVTLYEVQAQLKAVPAGADVAVKIFSIDADGLPDTDLYTLANPATVSANSLNTFTAPANATLEANTTYTVVFENDSNVAADLYRLARTDSNAEDSGAVPGWSIADKRSFTSDGGATWSLNSDAGKPMIAIRTSDSSPPVLSRATVEGTKLTLTYDEALDTGSTPATSAFAVTVAGTARTVSNVAVSGTGVNAAVVTLTFSGAAVMVEQAVTLSYTVPSTNPIQDTAGNDAAALTSRTVTQLVTAVANTAQTATAAPHIGVGPSGTSHWSNALAFTTGASALNLADVEARLGTVPPGAGVQVSIWSATSAGLPNAKLYNLTNPAVITASASNTFTAPLGSVLDATTTYVVVFENTATGDANLYRALQTDSNAEDSGAASGWSIADNRTFRDGEGSWSAATVAGKPMFAIRGTVGPTLTGAQVNGRTLTLTYDKTLDSGSRPAGSAFTVTVAGQARTVTSVVVSGQTVRLTLSGASVIGAQTVTVSYAAPSTNPIQDSTGVDAGSFTDRAVTVYGIKALAFTSQPTGSYALIGGHVEVTVTFSEAATVTGTPRIQLAPAFGPSSETRYADYVSGSGTTELVFRYTLVDGDNSGTTNVSVPANGLDRNGAANNATIRFGTTNVPASHITFDSGKTLKATRPATAQSASLVQATKRLAITFDAALDEQSVPAPGQFQVGTLSGSTFTATNTATASGVAGKVVSLVFATVATNATHVRYQKPTGGDTVLRDANGSEVATFTFEFTEGSVTDYDTDNDRLIEINTAAQLSAIRLDLDGNGTVASGNQAGYFAAFTGATAGMGCPGSSCKGYELTSDVDLAGYANWAPIGTYAATFEGNGYTAANLTIDSGDNNLGLFSVIGSTAVVRNLGVTDARITARTAGGDDQDFVGALAGENSGLVEAAYSTGTVTCVLVEAGDNSSWCEYFGGLVGFNHGSNARIRRSHSTVDIFQDISQNPTRHQGPLAWAGGLVGANGDGSEKATVEASFAAGEVAGYHLTGGLVGVNEDASEVVASYSVGRVVLGPNDYSEQGIGGLVGRNDGTVTAGYYNSETSGEYTGSAWFDTTKGAPRTTAELAAPTCYCGIYARWNLDFDGGAPDWPWRFGTSQQYPGLADVRGTLHRPLFPGVVGAVARGATVALVYSEDLDEGSVPAAADFSVTVMREGADDRSVSVRSARVADRTVTLSLASSVSSADSVILTYTKGTNPLRGTGGTPAADLAGFVVSRAAPQVRAAVVSRSASPWVMTVEFDQQGLLGSFVRTSWSVRADGGSAVRPTSGSVDLDAGTVTLNLPATLSWDDTLTVSYRQSGLRNSAGSPVASFTFTGTTWTSPPYAACTLGPGPDPRNPESPCGYGPKDISTAVGTYKDIRQMNHWELNDPDEVANVAFDACTNLGTGRCTITWDRVTAITVSFIYKVFLFADLNRTSTCTTRNVLIDSQTSNLKPSNTSVSLDSDTSGKLPAGCTVKRWVASVSVELQTAGGKVSGSALAYHDP